MEYFHKLIFQGIKTTDLISRLKLENSFSCYESQNGT